MKINKGMAKITPFKYDCGVNNFLIKILRYLRRRKIWMAEAYLQ